MKKFICILLAFTLLLSVCTACGKKAEAEEPAEKPVVFYRHD